MTPEVSAQIAIWRHKTNEGTITVEEMRQAVDLIRGSRKSAAISSEQARKTRAKKEIKSADEMLGELGI